MDLDAISSNMHQLDQDKERNEADIETGKAVVLYRPTYANKWISGKEQRSLADNSNADAAGTSQRLVIRIRGRNARKRPENESQEETGGLKQEAPRGSRQPHDYWSARLHKSELKVNRLQIEIGQRDEELEAARSEMGSLRSLYATLRAQYEEEVKRMAAEFEARSNPKKRPLEDESDEVVGSPKRVAVAEPRRESDYSESKADRLRKRLEQRDRELEAMRSELESVRNRHANMHAQYETGLAGRVAELEGRFAKDLSAVHLQMQDYHTRVQKLTETNKQLADASAIQAQTSRAKDEAREREVRETKVQYERELERRDADILSLRQRLEETRERPIPPAGSTNISQSRGSERHRVVRSDPPALPKVPLRPAPTTTFPSNEPSTSGIGEDPGATPTVRIDVDSPQFLEKIGKAVKEAFMGLNTPNKKRSPRRATHTTAWSEAIKAQQEKLSIEDDREWKAQVRKFWKTTHGINDIKDFGRYKPADQDDVGDCEVGDGEPDEDLVLDFGKGFEKSRWNTIVLQRIYDRITDARGKEGGWGLPKVTKEYLLGLLHQQLKRSRDEYRMVQPRYKKETGKMESPEEVIERVQEHMTERSETKLVRRQTIVDKAIAIKTGEGADDLSTWTYFKGLLEKLDIDGMSEEEEDVQRIGNANVNVFKVRKCAWRAPQILDYLKYIDDMGDHEAVSSKHARRRCPRIQTEEVGKQSPQKGLPLKMYNEKWLGKQKSGYKEVLEISNERFELLDVVLHPTTERR